MRGSRIDEKRKYKRLDVKGDVLLRAESGGGFLLKASLNDISFSGFRIHTARCFEVDEYVKFELITKFSETPLNGTGKIRHVKRARLGSYLAGAQFMDTDPDWRRNLIERALRARSKAHSRGEKFVKKLRLAAKIAPLIILFSLIAVTIINAIASNMSEKSEYDRRLRDATIYYLYHPN